MPKHILKVIGILSRKLLLLLLFCNFYASHRNIDAKTDNLWKKKIFTLPFFPSISNGNWKAAYWKDDGFFEETVTLTTPSTPTTAPTDEDKEANAQGAFEFHQSRFSGDLELTSSASWSKNREWWCSASRQLLFYRQGATSRSRASIDSRKIISVVIFAADMNEWFWRCSLLCVSSWWRFLKPASLYDVVADSIELWDDLE